MSKAISIEPATAALSLHGRIYDELYEGEYIPRRKNSLGVGPGATPEDIEEAGVAYYEDHIRADSALMGLVGECVRRRNDAFTSDREVSALAWALDELGVLA